MPPLTTLSSSFAANFKLLTGHEPMSWQERLFDLLRRGCIPDAIDLPTGLGKTSIMAIWLLARAACSTTPLLPRRLIYVVDRRVVVDQATAEAEAISTALNQDNLVASELRNSLGLRPGQVLPISTLRGGRADDREWTYDAAAPAIVVGTIDMIGSRLLFSGYRMGPWSRSVHAGLIGVDSLIVLDEAHLSPAFCAAVPRALQFQAEMSCIAVPATRFLPLSATLERPDGGHIFQLESVDQDDPIVVRRTGQLAPTKRLTLKEVRDAKGQLVEALAESAAEHDGRARAVLMYCTSRKDANATAEKLRKALGKGRETDVGLITGARRGYERDLLVRTETYRAFTYDESGNRIAPADGRTRFLVCTAAGEVGADLDADAAIMELAPLERMIQRLGRVNRRGVEIVPAPVIIYYDSAMLGFQSGKEETKREAAARLSATKSALESLPTLGGGDHDGSPCHLAVIEPNLRKAASTPPPVIIPTIEREHVEAWALTSIRIHPGRPNVEPFLRGVVEEEPQTTVAWRADVALLAKLSNAAIEQAMTTAPLHPTEALEAPTSEVADVLIKRLSSLRKTRSGSKDDERALIAEPLYLLRFKNGKPLERRRLVLSNADSDLDGNGVEAPPLEHDPKQLARFLNNATILLQPEIGGLEPDGALADCAERPGLHIRPDLVIRRVRREVDDGKPDVELIGASPLLIDKYGETLWARVLPRPLGLRRAWSVQITSDTEDDDGSVLEYCKPWDVDGETGSATRSQSLGEHHEWAMTEMVCMTKRLGVSDPLVGTLACAIGVHDLGKDRLGWQNGVGAPRDGRPYAKSGGRGPGIGNYRHEFGSLRDVLYKNPGSLDEVDGELRDLALHLIAAHHGRARPSILAEDEEEIFQENLAQDAFDAALRYVRLQRRWGPWGLAWLEALFRSVDATVSRRLDREKEPAGLSDIGAR